MNSLLSKVATAASIAVSLFVAASAQAAVAIYVGPPGSCGASGCFAPAVVTNQLSTYSYTDFDAGLPGTYSGTGSRVIGSLGGVYAAPFGDTTHYLTVGGDQAETIIPGGVHNVFGLYWGSVDIYNTIQFYLNNVLQDSFAGNDARLTGITANGGQLSANSNQYVSFVGITFDRIVLRSTANAFESDNHLIGSVPEPSVVALIAMALLSMFGMTWMRRQRSV